MTISCLLALSTRSRALVIFRMMNWHFMYTRVYTCYVNHLYVFIHMYPWCQPAVCVCVCVCVCMCVCVCPLSTSPRALCRDRFLLINVYVCMIIFMWRVVDGVCLAYVCVCVCMSCWLHKNGMTYIHTHTHTHMHTHTHTYIHTHTHTRTHTHIHTHTHTHTRTYIHTHTHMY